LPMVGNPGGMAGFDPKVPINEPDATKMIEHAIEQGINYFDTAYAYHGGQSEVFLGKTLKPHRSKVMIATKLPTWFVEKSEDMDRFFNEQLQRLGTDYIDCYLLHGLGSITWPKIKEKGVLEFLDRLKASGRIRFAGFSFHDEIKLFKEIVDAYDWSMCMVQYNYFDQDFQAGTEGIAYAASRDIGVVAMEPLRGGKLADKIPPEIQEIWNSGGIKRDPVEWAMRWVWNNKNIATVLTGASTLEQIAKHTRISEKAIAGSLSQEDLSLITKVRTAFRKLMQIDCTGCAYCMPCPNSVDIPQNFNMYNDSFLFNAQEMNAFFYNQFMSPEQRASNCSDCLVCIEKCPQKIIINEQMKVVQKYFEGMK